MRKVLAKGHSYNGKEMLVKGINNFTCHNIFSKILILELELFLIYTHNCKWKVSQIFYEKPVLNAAYLVIRS